MVDRVAALKAEKGAPAEIKWLKGPVDWIGGQFQCCAAPRKRRASQSRKGREDFVSSFPKDQEGEDSAAMDDNAPSKRQSVVVDPVRDDEELPSMELTARRSMDESEPAGTYEIEIPSGCFPGDTLVAEINGEKVKVKVPPGGRIGDVLTFVHTPRPRLYSTSSLYYIGDRRSASMRQFPEGRASLVARRSVESGDDGPMMEVEVPEGALPGDLLKVTTPSGLCSVPIPVGAVAGTILVFAPPELAVG